MTATSTSIDVFHTLDTREQCARILSYVRGHHPCTRLEIATALNMQTGTVSGRVNELLERNELVRTFKAPCPISGHRVEWVTVPPMQLELAA
jgi:hypothetical protein